MNGWERIQTIATGKQPDRIPVFCNLLDQGAQELGMPIKEYYARAENVAAAQLQMRARYGYDSLWGFFYVGKEAEILGCRHIIYAEDGPPNVGELVIKTPEDIHRLQIPDDIFSHPAFAPTRECLQILRRESAGNWPVCSMVTSSMTLPSILMGTEKWLELLLWGPAGLRDELLGKCSLFVRRHIQACRQAGAQLIAYAVPYSTPGMLPVTLCRSLGYSWMERDLKPAGTEGIVLHGGGMPIGPILPEILERLSFAACYLHPMDDIAACKRIIAGRSLCCGVINDIRLLSWSPTEVRAEVKRILAEGMPGGGFFFGTLVMPYGIPAENIRVMMDAVAQFGAAGQEG